MTPQRSVNQQPVLSDTQRERLQPLFERALQLPRLQQSEFVVAECGDDEQLRGILLNLLAAADGSDVYFETLSRHVVGPALVAFAEDPQSDPGDVGQHVSHYEIVEKIGGGGMGVVYKARDLRLGRTVALKFLPPQLTSDPVARARLLAEARAASALDHPNIGVVYEIADGSEERPFIAMAWYEGETLLEKLRSGPLPIADAVAIAGQLAGALASAHAAGIIHRDVKPANVLVTRSGTAKLLDFGIAKLIGTDITAEPVRRGTLPYMSPEQTQGRAIDGRTDVWSLGVLLYEMLAGQRPFRGESDAILVKAIRSDAPRAVTDLRPEVPPSLEKVVNRCLRKEVADRYQDALEVATQLRRWLEDGAATP